VTPSAWLAGWMSFIPTQKLNARATTNIEAIRT